MRRPVPAAERMKIIPSWLIFLAAVFLPAAAVRAGFFLDLEGGLANNLYNDIRVPGDTGTRFSLTDDFSVDNTLFWRARLGWEGGRHSISLLAAPLRFTASGDAPEDIVFTDRTFPAGESLSAGYRFDSYRATYRYRLVQTRALDFGLGLTGKVRDAAIRLSGDGRRAEKTNVGFVPLVNFRLEWRFARPLSLLLEGDALAAPQGRAEDVLLALQYRVRENLSARLGYRILEGGADNDRVYNFSAVGYFGLGLTYRL